MKAKTKRYLVPAFLGAILLTSTIAIAIPGLAPPEDEENNGITITGTPADRFPDAQREQFCGSGNAKSNDFVTEYKIPTACTQPLAISVDPNGQVWFAQTNTGNIAKFDPISETFIEFENSTWPPEGRSMMWGMDYSPDGSIWYTDEVFDSIWKFSILNEEYQRIQYPSEDEALPQKLEVVGSEIIVNDFTGSKITFLDPSLTGELQYLTLPSPLDNSFTSDFAIAKDKSIWYTNWNFETGDGALVKFDKEGYYRSIAGQDEQHLPLFDFIEVYEFPVGMDTPNGAVILDEQLWIADTSGSFLFKFDISSKEFTRYVTSKPPQSSYGNSTGIIKTPTSNPYWLKTDSSNIVFNEQTANRIGIIDPEDESLIEYVVPSQNPNWADCGENPDCGVSQIFDFEIDGNKIWFTEWVENNIGVVDTSKSLPLSVQTDIPTLSLKPGESTNLTFVVTPESSNDLFPVFLVTNTAYDYLEIKTQNTEHQIFQLDFDAPRSIDVAVTANKNAIPGAYKILLGAATEQVSLSKFITVEITE